MRALRTVGLAARRAPPAPRRWMASPITTPPPAAAGPAVQQPEELVAVVDAEDRFVRAARRAEVRGSNLWHCCSFCFVFNPRGQLLVQKRMASKETYPSHLDPCPRGVVGAGESYESNVEREAAEEMGVTGVEFEPLFDFKFEDGVSRVRGRAFACIFPGEVVLQPEEVESGEWVTLEEAKPLATTAPVCPDSNEGGAADIAARGARGEGRARRRAAQLAS